MPWPHMRFTQAQGVPNAQAGPYRPELSAEHGVTLVETLISAAILVLMRHLRRASRRSTPRARTTAVNRAPDRRRDARRAGPGAPARLSAHARSPTTTRRATKSSSTATTYTVDVATRSGSRRDGRRRELRTRRQAGRLHPHHLDGHVDRRRQARQAGRAAQPRRPARRHVRRQPGHARRPGQERARRSRCRPRRSAITGPGRDHVDTTNELGCAVFSHIPTGDVHDPRSARPGWVDPSRQPAPSQHRRGHLPASKTTRCRSRYAQAAAVDGALRHERRRRARGTARVAAQLIAANPGVPAGVAPVLARPPRRRAMTAAGLFPFPRRLHVLQRRLRRRRQPDAVRPGLLRRRYPGFTQGRRAAATASGDRARAGAQPARHARAEPANSAAPLKDAYVIITLDATGLRDDRTSSTAVNPNGTLPEPGLPFGTYTVCADDRNDADPRRNRRTVKTTAIVHTTRAGSSTVNADPQLDALDQLPNSTRRAVRREHAPASALARCAATSAASRWPSCSW